MTFQNKKYSKNILYRVKWVTFCMHIFDMIFYHHVPWINKCQNVHRIVIVSHCVSGFLTSSMTISAAFRTDSMTSPRARHTPTWPGDNPLRRPHGSAPDTGRERGRRARELQREVQHSRRTWRINQIQNRKIVSEKKLSYE